MKRAVLLLSVLSLCACTDNLEPIQEIHEEAMKSQVENTHRVDEAQALEYANLYFSQTQTRSTADLKRDYIVEDIVTRSGQAAKDTLAYVFNRGEEEGFVLIATDNRIYPLLAFSETGYFEYEKGSTVDFAFVSRLGAYYEENEGEEEQIVTEEILPTCTLQQPSLSTSWGQGEPWDKYVIQEHPGCPVGCLAVATGMIMAHCKDSLTYHNVNFDFATINETLRTQGITPELPVPLNINANSTSPMSKETAIDYVARLLFLLGQDMHMTYLPEGSGADIKEARNVLINNSYDVLDYEGGLFGFNTMRGTEHLMNNYLLLMYGENTNGKTAHSWVGDGYAYCINKLLHRFNYIAIHCDWGWNGSCNGYYTGEVFDIPSVNRAYKALKHYSIKNENEEEGEYKHIESLLQ